MDCDDLLREAAYEAARETLVDWRIKPDEEEERLVRILRQDYRLALENLRADQEEESEEATPIAH